MSRLTPNPGTWLFCNDNFARVVFEILPDRIVWMAIKDFSQKKLDEGFHKSIDAYEWQIYHHPKIRVLGRVEEWLETNNIVWPFTLEERVLFELTFG